ncbi:Na+/H+ antiporter subunit G [Spartobacteria bacterium LR76]|nr:Na+/H+ antiporter subunit G [Spartobacteria bacterium LR76]
MIREILISVLLLVGSLLVFLSGLGLLRFSDALCRSHALAKASTCGICLMLAALILALDNDISGLKIFLVMTFTLLTIPLAGHLTAQLVYRHEQGRLRKPASGQKKSAESKSSLPADR